MGEKLVVGPINKGLKTDRTPFVIDNDSFPVLINAYQWRGRVKRKRGTQFLCRLTRFFNSTLQSYTGTNPPYLITLVGGSGNLLGPYVNALLNSVTLDSMGTIVPGSVTITDTVTGNVYTDPNMDGTLIGTPTGTGTINYATGAFTITGGGTDTVSAVFNYYPGLPVMGLEDFVVNTDSFPFTIGFDTTYSYDISTSEPYSPTDVSFFNNPATGTYPGYIAKTNWTPVTWNGEDYQQFYTVNYQGAMWATNGIDVPFTGSTIGLQFQAPSAATQTSATTVNFTFASSNLVVGDFVFAYEFTGTAGSTLNGQTGYITAIVGTTYTVTFPNATIAATGLTPGILQFLTNRSDPDLDNIRWYNGSPTSGAVLNPSFVNGAGWVNFMPPLSQFSYSVSDSPLTQYYLVGARMIVPFKDRLLFLGPVIQSSSGSPIYLQDTVIYSQNGTAYYTSSWTGNVFAPGTGAVQNGFLPILVPKNQTATPFSYWEDQTGFGGFITAGIDQAINTVSSNEDALIIGFDNLQTRLIYSGNDIVPFNFYIINAELGSSSVFSTINMDQGVITRGNRGYVITGQTSTQRIDVEIPDQVFEIDLLENGEERFCAQRDFVNEWIYFTYPSNTTTGNYTTNFPDTTLLYNYRDNSWAIFYESYTTYGAFKKQTGFTWATVGTIYPTWNDWNDPWNAGESSLLQPQVIGGNQQGFVLIKGIGTGEGTSLYIENFASSVVTSPNHNMMLGDYIMISGCIGEVSSQVNGKIFSVNNPTTDTFTLDPPITSATYFGGGLITKFYVPFIQTKQFPSSWGLSRKTRIGFQQYLLSKTENSQITLQIYLSTDNSNPYNQGPIIPANNSMNDGLIYSSILYTCPESLNIGLTPSNINLQMVTANNQQQIWHRVNTSLIGDTIQLGFTISDTQMRALDVDFSTIRFSIITAATNSNPCVITTRNSFTSGQFIRITGVIGMSELNFNPSIQNFYEITSVNSNSITLNVDSTLFGAYAYGGFISTATIITSATNADPCVLTVSTNTIGVGQLVRIFGIDGMTQLNFDTALNNYYVVIATTATTITLEVDSSTFGTYTSGGYIVPIAAVNQTAEVELHAFILDVSPSQLLS